MSVGVKVTDSVCSLGLALSTVPGPGLYVNVPDTLPEVPPIVQEAVASNCVPPRAVP